MEPVVMSEVAVASVVAKVDTWLVTAGMNLETAEDLVPVPVPVHLAGTLAPAQDPRVATVAPVHPVIALLGARAPRPLVVAHGRPEGTERHATESAMLVRLI
eukprot:Colp12_sorted_trinity150504_noHs@29768